MRVITVRPGDGESRADLRMVFRASEARSRVGRRRKGTTRMMTRMRIRTTGRESGGEVFIKFMREKGGTARWRGVSHDSRTGDVSKESF